MSNPHAIRVEGSRFWITHRDRQYGPFDYAWSADFAGCELLYAGRKFGEYCSRDEIYADLKEFRLPMTVVRVSSIVAGCLLYGVLNGLRSEEREQLLNDRLCDLGYPQFSPRKSA